MYLNVNVNSTTGTAASGTTSSGTASSNLLSVTGTATGEVTPRTPEIVNSLIAMTTNPFDSGFGAAGNSSSNHSSNHSALGGANQSMQQNSLCTGGSFHGSFRNRDRADSSSSGEPSPPSIQHTCSQLIKEGLKLTLQTKRRANGVVDDLKKRTRREDGSADDEEDDEFSNTKNTHGLTPEDEERRRRRRERNKIAATKCRLKKREKTVILVQESETLESQNHELKSQIQELETQRRRLVDMLNLHGPTCLKQPIRPGGGAVCLPHPSSACTTNTSAALPTEASYHQQQQQYEPESDPLCTGPLPSCYQENYVPGQINTSHNDCNPIISGYAPVKVEGFEVSQDFFRQDHQTVAVSSSYTTPPTSTTTTKKNCSDQTGCPV